MKIFRAVTVAVTMLLAVSFIPFTAYSETNERYIYNFLTTKIGYNMAAACGVLANIECESGFDPNIKESGYTWEQGCGYGICQWTNSPRTSPYGRRTDMVNWCKAKKLDYTKLDSQLQYLKYELENDYPKVHSILKSVPNNADGAFTAAYSWCYYYEIPYGYDDGVSEKRGNMAKLTYWQDYSGQTVVLKPGNYKVLALTGLTVRSSASLDGAELAEIPLGTTIYVSKVSGMWGYVTYNGKSGWGRMLYLLPMDTTAAERPSYPTVSGDFTGDGKDDVAVFRNDNNNSISIDCLISNGSKFAKAETIWNSGSGWYLSQIANRMVVGDFNGDKKDDICAFYDYGGGHTRAFVWLSTGNGFKLIWNYWEMSSGFSAERLNNRVVAGDFNGDGKDDICAFYDYGNGESRAFVWLSAGSNFSMNWNYWYMSSGFDANRISTRVTAGDFNGDKKDDICAFFDYGKGECRAFVWQSAGSKFNMNWNYWYMSSGFDANRISTRVTAGDFNGDKKDDVCAFYNYGKGENRAFVWQSAGNYLSMKWDWWYIASGFDADNMNGRVVAGDFNGDKKDDVGVNFLYADDSTKMFVYRSQNTNFTLDWNW